MNVFVTGASGFIGTRVASALVAHGHQVTALVRGDRNASAVRAFGAAPLIGDIRDAASLPAVAPDAVFHFASAPTEEQHSGPYLETDTLGARNLVKRYSTAHFLYASSVWVYGDSDALQDEAAPLRPATGLGRAKQQVEAILRQVTRTTILRIGAIYPGGAFERRLIQPARSGRLFCPGRGENFISVISIEDVAAAFVAAVEVGRLGTFNLVDDNPLTWRSMTAVVAAHYGHTAPRSVPLWLVRLIKGRDVARYVSADLRINNAHARAAGFTIIHKRFADGLFAFFPRPSGH